ncbi:MAG: hypothetical protein AABX74_06560 [Nanoarchaeota archaeon]
MGIESKLGHRFEEMKTHVIDKAMFGQEDRLLAIISWIDLYSAQLKATYTDAVRFLNRYLAPHLNHPIILDFAKIMPDSDMRHRYDNAFRIEALKPERRYDENGLY